MKNYLHQGRVLLKLSIPVLLAQVAQNSMGVVDTIMAGGVSPTDMAAVAVASSIWFPIMLFNIGMLLALVPIIAQLVGGGKKHKVAFEVQQGFYVAAILSIPTFLIIYNAGFLVNCMDIEPLLAEKTIGYLKAIVWSVPAFLLFQVMRSFTEGCADTKPGMVIGFIGLFANIPLNWIFVYGKFGMPALGGVGCGVASAIVMYLMCISMFFYIKTVKKLDNYRIFYDWIKPRKRAIKRLVKLGTPVALSIFFEVSLFAVVALLIAHLGSIVVAAHQIAMSFSSIMFILPFSMSTAVSIRVGHQLGAKKYDGAKTATYSAWAIGVVLAIISASFCAIFREDIARLYNDDPQVIVQASFFMLLCAIYQCVDACQIISQGVLRGYKDMKAIFVFTLVAYWGCGLPVGYILALTDVLLPRMGPAGFWIGFIVGLSIAAILFVLRIRWIQKQPVSFQEKLTAR